MPAGPVNPVEEDDRTIWHVYPVGGGHEVEADDCWCDFDRLGLCLECVDLEEADPECWNCGGRAVVPCHPSEPLQLIVHENAPDLNLDVFTTDGDDGNEEEPVPW